MQTYFLKPVLSVLLVLQAGLAFAQGGIAGRVFDDKKEPLPSTIVQIFQNDILVVGNTTDYDGNYVIKSLAPGWYDVLVKCSGYDSALTRGISITKGQITHFDYILNRQKPNSASWHSGCAWRTPLTTLSGPIYGNVYNNKNEPLQNALITVYADGKEIAKDISRPNGFYSFAFLAAGKYEVKAILSGYDSIAITLVPVRCNGSTHLDLQLPLPSKIYYCPVRGGTVYRRLIDIDNPTKRTFTREDIEHLPH